MGLEEQYILLPAKNSEGIGLLCRMASRDQLLPPPVPLKVREDDQRSEMTTGSDLMDLKFDLWIHIVCLIL